jgi:dsDNA-specific endonuclease/ATPase MutS2
LFEARKLKKKLQNLSAEYVDESDFDTTVYIENEESPDFIIGEKVFYKPLKAMGQIAEINKKGEIVLKMGAVSSKVKAEDCSRVQENKPSKKQILESKSELHNSTFKTELLLLGQASDEAIYNTDIYLDQPHFTGNRGAHCSRKGERYTNGVPASTFLKATRIITKPP